MAERQQSQTQPPPFNLAPEIQAELTTLNVRYRDMQETMSRLITILAAENAELKTENTTLKNQLTILQAQNNVETHTKK
ncbi:MAG: hypothetical protein FWH37_10165 [Candidatus Bathyarchaeota archaeon]|nr:hypothetical protein [Candidatus Termiticorpusculum sp.]